jgi:cysteinyl-tRNA synthetase
VLDIHAGGVDLIFPHHEDEIAQSCAFTGKDQFARYWLHGEFLNMRGSKMSKRFGNITTPRDLREDGVDPGAVRLLMFQTHYRQKLDLTDDGLAAAQEASRRLGEFQNRLKRTKSGPDSPRLAQAAERLNRDLVEALNDDLNAPRAVAAMFVFMNEGNAALDAGERPETAVLSSWEKAEGVLGVTSHVHSTVVETQTGELTWTVLAPTMVVTPPITPPSDPVAAQEWATGWATARAQYKSARNYAEADRIRALLGEHGFQVRDSRDGSIEVVRTAGSKSKTKT